MTRFIIFVQLGVQTREALVQHLPGYHGETKEVFTVHPKVDRKQYFPNIPKVESWESWESWESRTINIQHFISFGKAIYKFESDRPLWRSKGVKRRPNYRLIEGEIKNRSHLEKLIAAIDGWVERNMD